MLSNKRVVEVVEDGSTIDAARNLLQVSVLSGMLSTESGVLGSCQRSIRVLVAFAKDVILVDKSHLRFEFQVDLHAYICDVGWERSVNVGEVAVVGCEVIIHGVTNKAMIVAHVEVGRVTIVFPVGHTVANHEPSEVGLPVGGLSVVDVLVNTKSQLRHVDASVGLSRNVQIIVLKSSEFSLKQSQHRHKVVISRVSIVEFTFVGISADRVAYSSGSFNVNHVSVIVPRPVVESEVGGSICQRIRAMLLGPAEHRRAARTAIEPDNNWIIHGIIATESCYVMEFLLGSSDWHIT